MRKDQEFSIFHQILKQKPGSVSKLCFHKDVEKHGKCENASETRQQRSSRLENARRADPRTPARKGALLTALLKLRVEVSSTDYTKDFVAVSPVTACRPSSPRAMFPTTVGRFAVSRCRKRASAPRESCGAPAFGERRPRGVEGATPSGANRSWRRLGPPGVTAPRTGVCASLPAPFAATLPRLPTEPEDRARRFRDMRAQRFFLA